VVVFLVFITSGNNQLVVLDDYGYIVDNRNIATLSWATIRWSFTSYCEGNWHPLTMLSLALDRSLWGVTPYGYHVENAAIHSCTVFFLCFLFSYILKAVFAKTFLAGSGTTNLKIHKHKLNANVITFGSVAAALFWGLHPLRVESVVWASERKDVLCLLFMTLSLLMYVRHVIGRQSAFDMPSWRSNEYVLAVVFAALAVMSKPTAVSLPLIMSIIDYYPFMKVGNYRSLFRSLVDKIPFFIISGVGVTLTLLAQQGAMKCAPDVGLSSRLLIACKALLFYLYATVIPDNLAAFYAHPGNIVQFALLEYAFYALLILVVSIAVVLLRHSLPALSAFWMFHLVSLVPMLGIIQVGGQWAADRYSYLPSLGISIVWGAILAFYADRIYRKNRVVLAWSIIFLAMIQLSVYTVLTLRQISVWRTTETLTTRIINQSPNVPSSVYLSRAIYRNQSGRSEEALDDTYRAMKIALRNEGAKSRSEIAFEQAVILKQLRRYKEALMIMEWGIEVSTSPPDDAIKLKNELIQLQNGNL
jgi:hypothetical protein